MFAGLFSSSLILSSDVSNFLFDLAIIIFFQWLAFLEVQLGYFFKAVMFFPCVSIHSFIFSEHVKYLSHFLLCEIIGDLILLFFSLQLQAQFFPFFSFKRLNFKCFMGIYLWEFCVTWLRGYVPPKYFYFFYFWFYYRCSPPLLCLLLPCFRSHPGLHHIILSVSMNFAFMHIYSLVYFLLPLFPSFCLVIQCFYWLLFSHCCCNKLLKI